MINIDLHIHSYASKYKEAKDVVEMSTVENAETLMAKLEENNVGLFSITDHNRFWPELYNKFDELIESGDYPSVKGLVAGVEFDVQLDLNMGKCHIITIFDANNNESNYQKIHDVIEKNKIVDKNGAYSRSDYEHLLKEIGLDVILIACQRSDLGKHEGKHNSLSESTLEPEHLLLTGYINALEFQRPNVEGILKNNLRDFPNNVTLIMGSDCHQWSAYPYHDDTNKNKSFKLSRAKILPTFKGLLMAVTSPETRINPQESKNRDCISALTINGTEYPLENGINAIIGENGSGKSTILKLLHDYTKDQYANDLMDYNNMSCRSVSSSKRLYIGQGEIVKKFEENKLFPSDNFIEVDNSEFRECYRQFSADILTYIKNKIKAKDAIDRLSKETLLYSDIINETNYFINFEVEPDYSEVENEHIIPNRDIRKVLKLIVSMEENNYYDDYINELLQIHALLIKIYANVHSLHDKKTVEKSIKNSIVASASSYEGMVADAANSRENDKRDYLNTRQTFINYIIDAIRKKIDVNVFPDIPRPIKGFSSNPLYGFSFNSEANYHNKDVVNDFLSQMFNKEYATIDGIKKIDTLDKLVNAVKGVTETELIELKYQNNLTAFLDQMCSCKNFIVDKVEGDESLGNTLGEMSLAYFRYISEQEAGKCVFLIDQPEDHISNNNISKKLLSYLNSIRYKKQIIIVTHNPLLVVNQDADNVMFVKKKGSNIDVVSGCLELEDENVNILDIVAKNMDGGKDSIEKRLRVYGKENSFENASI